ncbi:hypothetical protein OG474_36735 [Kribbella sp. NBC_01505]|uniref:hypothetical protein n=1 Tax=Kribbella sp. NBC_01505 TaxID=2903580 RepID=UPI003870956B
MNAELVALINSIADLVGMEVADVRDEHERWKVYVPATDSDESSELLLRAVRLEPDPNVALSIVLRKLEWISDSDRQSWIDQLVTDKQRDYATRRARDLKVLETRPLAPALHQGIDESWSDWLQVRLAEFSPEPEVACWLSQHGRTKRIRRLALERTKKL